jgi:thiol-disulfide isomerase/thioredoxin
MKLLFTLATLLISLVAFSQSLPDFNFEAADGSIVNKSSLVKGKPLIVFYFDPTCDHCQAQAQSVKDNATKFRDINMIWVSWEEHASNKEFYDKYLSKIQHAIVCRDHNYKFDSWFGYSEVISIYSYNSKGERVAAFTKEQSAEVLLKAVE